MAIKELNHININTAKMKETRDFFVDIVGMEDGWRPEVFKSPGHWLYAGDVAVVHLSPSDPKYVWDKDPLSVHIERGSGVAHIGLASSDLTETEENLNKNGVPYTKLLAGNDRLLQVFFLDPNGVQVELTFDAEEEGVTRENFVEVKVPGIGI